MSCYQEVFKRIEKKYLLDENKYEQLLSRINSKIVSDKYGECTICNVYFDTPNHFLIRNSIEKPNYKEKLRVRSYGVPNSCDTVFVELKKKYNGVVYKRRVDMSLEQAKKFTDFKIGPKKNPQIEKELAWVMNYYKDIQPALFLSYDRLAFNAKDDSSLRITFDSNVIYRDKALELDKGVWGTKFFDNNERIMEIKTHSALPIWLCEILSDLEIYPTSFSKYGTAYSQILKQENSKKEKVIGCA